MGSIRWNSFLAALVLFFGASPLFAESPLEELEAKLAEQEKGQDAVTARPPTPNPIEALPLPSRSKAPRSVELQGLGNNPPLGGSAPESILGTTGPEIASSEGEVLANDPPYLGLTLELPTTGEIGLRVIEVNEQSPAWKSGFRVGDFVVAVGSKVVNSIDNFAQEIVQYGPNEPITFLVDRRGRQVELVAVMLPRSIATRTQPNGVAPPAWSGRPNSPNLRMPVAPRTPQVIDSRGNIGLVLAPLSDAFRRSFGIPVFRGASVLDVAKDSPGFAAGLSAGDCLVEIDGKAVLSDEDVMAWKSRAQPGSLAAITFYRGASKMQTMLQVPADGSVGTLANDAWDSSKVTPEMLTPEYVSLLQSELVSARSALQSALEQIERLERRSTAR